MKYLKQGISTPFVLVLLSILSLSVKAVPIPADVSVTGTVEFSTVDSVAFSGAGSQTGSMSATQGGVTSSSTVSDVTVSGANPLGGALTDTGDGVAANATVTGSADAAADDFIFDFAFALTNSSLTDSFQLFFEIVFSNSADADGTDAFIDSEINLFDASNNEFFASDLTSDTFFGDSVNGVGQGSSGSALSNSGTFAFDFSLAAGASDSFTGVLKMDGEEFDGNGGFLGTADAEIRLVDVINTTPPPPPPTPMPEPNTAWLFLAALAGLTRLNKKQK